MQQSSRVENERTNFKISEQSNERRLLVDDFANYQVSCRLKKQWNQVKGSEMIFQNTHNETFQMLPVARLFPNHIAVLTLYSKEMMMC